MTDMNAFKLGVNVATSKARWSIRTSLMQIIQYDPLTPEQYRRPLLIFPPWINKFYILDLREKNSFIRWATQQGHTVFVVSWVNPDARLAHKKFEDYMFEGTLAALDAGGGGHRRARDQTRSATASAGRCSARRSRTWPRRATAG